MKDPSSISYFKDITALLKALRTFTPQSNLFHIHKHEEVPETHSAETQIFRSDTFSASFLIEGAAEYKIGLQEYTMQEGSFYFMSPRHLRYYKKTKPWKGFVFLFSTEFIRQFSTTDIYTEYPFFEIDANVQLQLNATQVTQLNELLTELLQIYQSHEKDKIPLLYHYVSIVLLLSKKWHREQHPTVTNNTKKESISKAFYDLLEKHFFDIATQKAEYIFTVADFAEHVHISANYLSNTLKKETGKTASQIIKQRTILEAKSLLKSTELTVSEVAYFLKFQDSSYFSKYFKSATKLSPSEFRDGK
ncbi:AraC family transcriptional regulator [Kordia sp. SMS9]|uniref:helix-turn-helix domain-containing protein n=1 Tax=Kordia sp. SMS9 TaxID=2282170 RepID=UPI000E0D68DA|nr:helix-turn-helix transcriptional regulator [Kordia sp. SMS9]